MKTIWIISGEASGDDYGAGLARALHVIDPTIAVKGMGAEKMRQAGVDIMVDSTNLGIVGIVEALKHITFFVKLLNNLTSRAAAERPNAVVLIDYPGFNLRFAQRLKALDIPVVYYISPQVWAWKKGRIPKLAASVSRMLCIFPFEPEVYAGTNMPAIFVGHPLIQSLAPLLSKPPQRDPNLVILLPGSRRGEYTRLIPVYMYTALALRKTNPKLRFHLPLRNTQNITEIREIITKTDPQFDLSIFSFSAGDARQWLLKGAAGIAASGTITVEATILGLPLVVTYKLNPLSWWYAKRVVKLPSVTICNLVTKKQVFQECLQNDATPHKLSQALLDIMPDGCRRQEVLDGMAECVTKLGAHQDVAGIVARNVLEVLR